MGSSAVLEEPKKGSPVRTGFDTPVLPETWHKLDESGQHPDFVEDVKKSLSRISGSCKNKRSKVRSSFVVMLDALGEGLSRNFEAEPFVRQMNSKFQIIDSHHETIREVYLAALQELAEEFSGRVSTLLWESLAALVLTRPIVKPEDPATNLSDLETRHDPVITACLLQAWQSTDYVRLKTLGVISDKLGKRSCFPMLFYEMGEEDLRLRTKVALDTNGILVQTPALDAGKLRVETRKFFRSILREFLRASEAVVL